MAHNELLSSLGLPPGSMRQDSDNFSVSSSSTSSAQSIALDDSPPKAPSPISEDNLPHDTHEDSNAATESSNLRSPSSAASTEAVSMAEATSSAAPTSRTSISSQVPSLSLAKSAVEDHLATSSHTVAASSSQANALFDAMSNNVAGVSSTEAERERTLEHLHRVSTTSSNSSLGKKVRPDSLLIKSGDGPLVLGIALVDFNHSVGPRVEMAHPPFLLQDEELCKILPFLALPDGVHQSSEDYSYFHLTPEDPDHASAPSQPLTAFGISCNRQIAVCDLLEKDADVSRSTVQKAVVVIASRPLFGMIRDRLGVVTTALFNQRDFRDTHILVDFYSNLEANLKTQLTESSLYMGTNLRELIHKFRHRTLTLIKLLMLQKKIMFYGHPVERLCTYQYSLVSLIPNLLMTLEDAASPNLDQRERSMKQATELKTSDRTSLLRYLGLPLHIFGKDAFFQPYLPLQQIDMLKTQSWLCGTTNTIVTQQKDGGPDLLINIEQNTFEFKDPKVERMVALTPADRKWIDDIVKDVNEGWNEKDPTRPMTMQFKGSDDYLRAKFEDYVCSALSTVKYADYLVSTGGTDMSVAGATGDQDCIQNFGEAWITAFRLSRAYTVWNRATDPALFDICEARHPCESKPTPISDIGLRLAEGLHELKVAETVAPAREALSNAVSVGSTGLFRAFETVRSEMSSRFNRQPSAASSPALTPSVMSEGTQNDDVLSIASSNPRSPSPSLSRTSYPPAPATPTSTISPPPRGLRPLSLAPSATAAAATAATAASVATEIGASAGAAAKATISGWGSFLAKKASEYRKTPTGTTPATTPAVTSSVPTTKEPTTPKPDAQQTSSIPTPLKTPSFRSPPLGFRGALWSLGERAEASPSQGESK